MDAHPSSLNPVRSRRFLDDMLPFVPDPPQTSPMVNLFDVATRAALLTRLEGLQAESERQWGKMTPAQMCAHCSAALEVATGETPHRRLPIGYLVGWMVRGRMLGPEPFPKSSPTDPRFVVSGPRDFAAERTRLREQVELFVARGREGVAKRPHSFLGRLSGDEWGIVMGKHLDHHLRQFGA